MKNTNQHPTSLLERIIKIDHLQARRFVKLAPEEREIAAVGIVRHLRACSRMDVTPDPSALREIIDDAGDGRQFYPTSADTLTAA